MSNNNGYVSYNSLLMDLSFRLGRDNLNNEETIIKRFIIDAEHEINPYSSLLVKKKVTYHKGNGNFDGKNIVKPKDFFEFDKIGSCNDGLCPGSYILNQSFIIICDGRNRDKVTFTYYGYACDGTGNPFTTINHKEAVLAYLEYMFYKPKIHKGKGNMNMYLQLERNWFDRCMESRGEDVMNEIVRDMDSLSKFVNTTARGMHNELDDSCESSSCCFAVEYDDSDYMNKKVYSWQFGNITQSTEVDETTTNVFLSDKSVYDLSEFTQGRVVNFTKIGKYGFVIEDMESEDSITIYDLTESSLENVFDKYYDPVTRRLAFLSKTFITHSSIYFKFNVNG